MKKVNYDFGWGYEHYEGRTLSERMSLFSCNACGFALCALMRPIYAFLLTAQARYAIIFPDYRRERRVSKLMCEELYKTSVISIDSYENRVLTGRICNPFLEEDVFFHSTMEFLKEMEALLQDLSFPQSYAENRTFRPSPERTPRVAALVAPAPKKAALPPFPYRSSSVRTPAGRVLCPG